MEHGMRNVVYLMNVSLDGYVESADGDSSWVVPDEELHRFFNEIERVYDTHIYGRRMYQQMADFWPTADQNPEYPDYIAEYARLWRDRKRIVYSKTLDEVDPNARLLREVLPEEIAALKAEPGKEISLGGPNLAATFMRLDLIDEYQVAIHPLILGGGVPMLAPLEGRLGLRLIETRTFDSGVVFLRYARDRKGTGGQ
jgi:dihydrofolate reductase